MDKIKLILHNVLVYTLSFQLVFQGLIAEAAAQPITIDASAPAANQATLTSAANGKALLDIVKPNSAGVSHNKFTDFNVTSDGLILNNATGPATTQLGGIITANPKFSGTSARLILNEVTGANRSNLSGYTEIGGAKADYILANPNGVTCNGCGFINTARATLTTGIPVMNAGQVTGFSVNAGDIAVEGLGLDASTADKFDIVTRAATINAQINAKDLGIYAGRQDFDYTNRTTQAKAVDGAPKPTFAIDSTALGGMYAGRISLVGTEAGVGVRFAADMAANAGDMTITADGQLVMNADATATGNLSATSTSSSVDVAKNIYAGGIGHVDAGTALNVAPNAALGAAGDLSITAPAVTLGAGAKIVAGMDSGGALSTNGTLNIQATTQITAGEGFLGGGAHVYLGASSINLDRATDDGLEGVRSRGTMRLETTNVQAANNRIAADGAMTIAGTGPLTLNAGELRSATDIAMSADAITSGATVIAGGAANMTASAGTVSNSGTISAGGDAVVNASGDISNSGAIASQTGTTLTAGGNITTTSTSTIKSAANTQVNFAGTLTNAGDVSAAGDLNVTGKFIVNTGVLAAGANLHINATDLTNDTGVLHALNNMTVGGFGGAANAATFDNASGVVETINGDISISADTITNHKKVFSSAQILTYAHYFNMSGSYHPGCNTIPGATISAAGCSYFPGAGVAQVPHPVLGMAYASYYTSTSGGTIGSFLYEDRVQTDSPSSLISAGGGMTLAGTTITNDKSDIFAAGNINISASVFSNLALQLIRDNYASSNSGTYTRCYGGPCKWFGNGGGTLLLERSAYKTLGATVKAGGTLTVTASGGVRNGTETAAAPLAPGTTHVQASVLSVAPRSSGLIDPLQYADLIPGKSALFVKSVDPNAKYLIETRPDFVDVSLFYGSDYFLKELDGFEPEVIPTRLGDAYYETQLVRQAVIRDTGERWLDPSVKDDALQMKALLDAGVKATHDLNLTFGVALTQAQMDALVQDIVVYQKEDVQGRSVLVPKLYLASSQHAKLSPAGALLAAAKVTLDGQTIDNTGAITSSGAITLTASGDLTNRSGVIDAAGDVGLTSKTGDIVSETRVNDIAHNNGNLQSIRHAQASITAGGKATLDSGRDIRLSGSALTAKGDITLTAQRDANIGVLTLRDRKTVAGGGVTEKHDNTTAVGSAVNSGGALNIHTGRDIAVTGSSLASTAGMRLQAGRDVIVQSAADTIDASGSVNKKGKSITGTLRKTTQVSARLQSGGDLNLTADSGSVAVIASKLNAADGVTLDAQNGKVLLGARKDTLYSHEKNHSANMWIVKSRDRGVVRETVVQTTIKSGGDIVIRAGGGVIADYKVSGNFEQSTKQLAALPGMAYIGQLKARSDVNWRALNEAHDHWDYKSRGLGPAAAVIISIAVGYATGGVGAQFVGASGGAASAVANTAFTTLSTRAASSLIANGGDIGAVLRDLGSSASIRALATSMVTAGVTTGALDKLGLAGDKLAFMQRVQKGLATSALAAAVDTGINRGKLSSSLRSQLASTVGMLAAFQIGQAYKSKNINKIQHLMAHAGGGALAAMIGERDPVAGALGAVTGELVAQAVDQGAYGGKATADSSSSARKTVLAAGQIAAVLAASVAGVSPEAAAQTAATAITYNYLTPQQLAKVVKSAEACGSDARCRQLVTDSAHMLSESQDYSLTFAKFIALFGHDQNLKTIQANLVNAARLENITPIVQKIHPDWNDARVQSQSIAYRQEFLSSLDQSTWRAVTGTLDVLGAVMAIGGTGGFAKGTESVGGEAAKNVVNGLRMRTELTLKEANILGEDGKLTASAIRDARIIRLKSGRIDNLAVRKILTKDGSNMEDWEKFTTKSVPGPNGSKVQVHFYKNVKTGRVDYETPDFKVKNVPAIPKKPMLDKTPNTIGIMRKK